MQIQTLLRLSATWIRVGILFITLFMTASNQAKGDSQLESTSQQYAEQIEPSLMRQNPPIETPGKLRSITQNYEWITECVDCPKYFTGMTDRSMRLDSTGNMHIAYGGDHLYYAWFDGATWQYEIVDSSPNVGSSASLFLEADGDVHISYSDNFGDRLMYAYRDASGWQSSPIYEEEDISVADTSLVVDQEGFSHISFRKVDRPCPNCRSDDLMYAYQDEAGWYVTPVDSSWSVGEGSSLALDNNSNPRISYGCWPGRLKFASWNGSNWDIKFVEDEWGGSLSFVYTSLALDENGFAHIGYTDSHDGYPFKNFLNYAYQDSSGWRVKRIDSSSQFVGLYPSIALDSIGQAHISHYDATNDNLKYAFQDKDGWHSEIAAEGFDVGSYSSITLDNNNSPLISFRDNIFHQLKIAHKIDTEWQSEVIDEGGDVGKNASMVLDEPGLLHVAYESQVDIGYPYYGFLRYGEQENQSWQINTILQAGNAVQDPSLSLDSYGRPHIAYSDEENDDLVYIYLDATGWISQTIDSEGYVGDFPSLAVDDEGKPHISYQNSSTHELRYAHRGDSSWEISVVDSDGDPGWRTSITIDQEGGPRIAYFDASNHLVKYAFLDGEDWLIETVGELIGWVGNISLALDKSDTPHIALYDDNFRVLLYTYRLDNGEWPVELVDPQLGVGEYASLAIDTLGGAHISYYDEVLGDLKYAYRNNDGIWHPPIRVDKEGDVGRYTTMIIDSEGFPVIGYYDVSNRDLKYVYATHAVQWRLFIPLLQR